MFRLLYFHVFLLLFLTSCNFSANKKKGITAEIISRADTYADNANSTKRNDSAEVGRMKNLLMNPELLDLSIWKSGFRHTLQEVKAHIFLENPPNTSIVDIWYNANDTSGATAFLDTLLLNLQKFDIAPELRESGQKIGNVQYEMDSIMALGNDPQNMRDSGIAAESSDAVYLKLIEMRANLIIERAGIISRIRILFWAHPYPEEVN